jgi:outer membrane protein assembly factor BamD
MLKIEKIIILFFVVATFTSCSEYHKVLNKGKVEDKYKMATQLFEQGKYNKAIVLFEKVIPAYERKPQMQRVMYMVAESYYKSKDYELSAYYFNRFIANYPTSSKIEEAAYLVAHSHYLAAPKYSRDQKDTHEALNAFQTYIDKYPSSERLIDANKFYNELTFRLEKKSFEIAKQYYHIEDYQAAIAAFENFLQEHIGSKLKEDALYYKFKASNDLAVNSVIQKKENRINNAFAVHDKFIKNYPESEKVKELSSLHKNLEDELKQIKELIENYKNTLNNGL